MKLYAVILIMLASLATSVRISAQGIPLGEILMVSNSQLRDGANPEDFESFMLESLVPAYNGMSEVKMYLLKADRRGRKGEILTACVAANEEARQELVVGSPFTDRAVSVIAGSVSRSGSKSGN